MATTSQFQSPLCFNQSATIASGQTTSGIIDLAGTVLVGLILPAAFDGTTLQFQCSDSANGTFYNYYNTSGVQVTATVAASRYVGIVPSDFANVRFIKLVAGTQTGDTTITLVTRPVG